MSVGNEVHASMEVYTNAHISQPLESKSSNQHVVLTLASQKCALVRLVKQALMLGLRLLLLLLLLLLLCLMLLEGQQLLLLLLLSC